MITQHVLELDRADDETLVIYLDGQEVGYANHDDEHGWAGMDAVENLAREIARMLGAKVIET